MAVRIIFNDRTNDIKYLCLSLHTEKWINSIKQEILVTTGDMTYVREVNETDFYDCMLLYFNFD